LTVLLSTTLAVEVFADLATDLVFLSALLSLVFSTFLVVMSSTKLTVARAALSPFLQPDFSILKCPLFLEVNLGAISSTNL